MTPVPRVAGSAAHM